jgi:hypothetical protein
VRACQDGGRGKYAFNTLILEDEFSRTQGAERALLRIDGINYVMVSETDTLEWLLDVITTNPESAIFGTLTQAVAHT